MLDELSVNYDDLLLSVHHLIFFTSGQCMIFDEKQNQIIELQAEFINGEANIPLLTK